MRTTFTKIRSLLAAPVFEDDEKNRSAGLLNTVLVSLLLALAAYAVIAPALPNPGRALPVVGTTLLLALAALILMRRGQVRAASAFFVTLTWALITVVSVFFEGVNGVPLTAYIVVVILGGLLLGGWGAFTFALMSVLAGLGMLLAEQQGVLPPPLGTNPPLTRFGATSLLIVLTALLLHIATRSLNNALQRARSNERALAESNRELQTIRQTLEEYNEHLHSTVERYVEHMSEVARGNLSVRLPAPEGDDPTLEDPLTLLGGNLNEATASLQRLARQTRDTAGRLNAAAAEILAAVTQQAAGSSQQSAAIAQTSTTIDEVRTIAEQTAQRAQGVADTARRTAKVSHAGQEAVALTIGGVQEVKEKVETIARNILALSEQAQTIGQIIAAVNEIAAQSNMLALNAAVEAARAGEAGKGFAVVAQEVRVLAEQSRAATVQIKELLTEIQQGVNAAVMATEEGMKGTDAGMRLAGEAGLALQRLAESVAESSQASTQIAAAAGQQLTGVEQIGMAMGSIHQVTAQSVAGTQQVERAAGELNELAGQLRELVEQYQL